MATLSEAHALQQEAVEEEAHTADEMVEAAPPEAPQTKSSQDGVEAMEGHVKLEASAEGGQKGLATKPGPEENRSKENLSQKEHRRGLKKSQPDHMRGLKQGHQATRRGLRQSQQGTRVGLRHSQQGTRMGLRQSQLRRRMGLKQSQQKRRRDLKQSQQAAELIIHCHGQERNLRKRVPRSRKNSKASKETERKCSAGGKKACSQDGERIGRSS